MNPPNHKDLQIAVCRNGLNTCDPTLWAAAVSLLNLYDKIGDSQTRKLLTGELRLRKNRYFTNPRGDQRCSSSKPTTELPK